MFKAESYEEMERLAKGNKEREAVVADLKKLGSDPEFIDYYDHDEFQEIRMMHEMEDARNEGLEEGHASGLAEGRESERIDIIKNMLESGMTIEELSYRMKIPFENIQKISVELGLSDYYNHDEFQEIRMMHEAEDARNEGLEEGRLEGQLNERKIIISNLLAKEKTLDEISELLNIPIEEIQNLID